MKNILRLTLGGIAAAFFALVAQAANLAPGAFSAGSVKGDVTYKVAGSSEYQPLKAGVALPQGATIKTGAKSSVLVVFGSGSTAVIEESSEIEITKFEQEVFSGPVPVDSEPSISKTEIKLIEGNITSKVAKLKKGSSYVIDTPVGAAGVRGTVFRVSYQVGSSTFSIIVTEGGVVYTPKDGSGQETLVEAGKKIDVAFDKGADGNITSVTIDLQDLEPAEREAIIEALGNVVGGGEAINVNVVGDSIIITPVDTTQVGVSTN
jgi:Uncharacterized protein conserved in bacteria